jgi:hypothetical protein
VAVSYTLSGAATNGTDYNALSDSATIAAGATYVDILVTPKDDTLVEGSETVVMTLTASPAFKMGTASATVTISDND